MASAEAMVIYFCMLGLYGQALFTEDNSIFPMGSITFTACVILINTKLQYVSPFLSPPHPPTNTLPLSQIPRNPFQNPDKLRLPLHLHRRLVPLERHPRRGVPLPLLHLLRALRLLHVLRPEPNMVAHPHPDPRLGAHLRGGRRHHPECAFHNGGRRFSGA